MKSLHNKRISNKLVLFILLTSTLLLLMGCSEIFQKETGQNEQEENIEKPGSVNEPDNDNSADRNLNDPENEAENEPEQDSETFTDIRIAAAGDIMFHETQLDSAYNAKTNSYDFNSFFDDVKPFIESADLALVNLETTLGGAEIGYRGYPTFNSPDETIDAIKNAGFDVLTTANNHSLDTGSKGLKRTAKIIREKGLSSVGSYDKKPESRVLMQEVKGIKIAVLSYTESTNGLGDQYPAEELNAMLNLMDKDIIKEDIQEAKERDADLIITFMHWGEEYMESPNATQVEFAEMMAEEGVDIILGSHPHVIQKSEFLEVDDHKAFVIYSMGNFVSNQRRETLGDGKEGTEDGVIVNFDIRKNDQTGETIIQNVEYTPTWVYRNKEKGESQYTYRILPIENFLDSTDISKVFQDRMKKSLENTVSKMETTPVEES